MKKIEAIIKPFKLEDVKEALSGIGVEGMTGRIVPMMGNIHLRFPEEAVQTVVRKARTPNCREAFYAAGGVNAEEEHH